MFNNNNHNYLVPVKPASRNDPRIPPTQDTQLPRGECSFILPKGTCLIKHIVRESTNGEGCKARICAEDDRYTGAEIFPTVEFTAQEVCEWHDKMLYPCTDEHKNGWAVDGGRVLRLGHF